MERTGWTDERIDDRMTAMAEKWDPSSRSWGASRGDAGRVFGPACEIATVRTDLWSFQKQVLAIVAAASVGLIGLLGTFVAAQF